MSKQGADMLLQYRSYDDENTVVIIVIGAGVAQTRIDPQVGGSGGVSIS